MQSARAFGVHSAPAEGTAVLQRRKPAQTRVSCEWTRALRHSDIERLWAALHTVVCRHPLVRTCSRAGLLEAGPAHPYTDLTQELFTRLLAKQRFQYYLDANMTDAEIEFEISQLELSNLLTLELYKRHPESYRLVRRISKIVQTSTRFRRCDVDSVGVAPLRRLGDQVYGLREWPADKLRCPLHEVEHRVQDIPICTRDLRLVGRTGDVQVIITNPALEALILRVLTALDTAIDVRDIRRLVLSRLSVQDIYLVSLDGGSDEDELRKAPRLVDGRANPEQALLRREAETMANTAIDQLFQGLYKTVRGNVRRYDLMLNILWHFYLSAGRMNQLAAAAHLGVSDTLVHNYRRQIEQQLRALGFSDIESARRFETALSERVALLVQGSESARCAVGSCKH